MIFFGNLIYSLICAYCIDKTICTRKISDCGFFALLLPIFIVWLAICGGQYYVGSDYPSYLEIFNGQIGDRYADSGEIGFVILVKSLNYIGIRGQQLFFFFYSINFFFLFLILKRIKYQHIFIYILLYITITGLFNNQLNILRQTTAIYIGTYAITLIFEEKKLKGICFILIACSFHISSIILFTVFLHRLFTNLTPFWLNKCIYISFLLGTFLNSDFLMQFIPFLSENYAWHIQSGAVEQRSIILQLTKFMFIPIYLLAISKYNKYKLSYLNKSLFHFGIISFCIRLLLINMTIVSRIGDAFLLLSIYPLHIYMNYLYNNNKYLLFCGISSLLILFYFVKTVIFPSGEYLYQSIYY